MINKVALRSTSHAEGDLISYAEGTHKGTFHTPGGDIPPTDRPVNLTFSQDFEIQDGVIVAVRHHFDRLELLEQLGAMPAPAPA
jgi:predicted ester cyclase